MMFKISLLLTLAASIALAGTATAQTNFFTHFDKDKNGRVTTGEISHQRDGEIIAALDTNLDGSVTPDEWRTSGRGASYIEKGGVDDRGVTQRWIEFNIVFFSFENEVISTNWTQGQAPLAPDATPQDVARMRETIEARNLAPPENYARAVELKLPQPTIYRPGT